MTPEERIAIVFDGKKWYVRRITVIEHDMERDHKVYRCDKPISNDHATLADVPQVAAAIKAENEACVERCRAVQAHFSELAEGYDRINEQERARGRHCMADAAELCAITISARVKP